MYKKGDVFIMKHYIIADIHGCFEEYKILLEALSLTSEDEVYILGDSIDRGKEPIKVLKDIMNRPNFTHILGNHEFMMLKAIRPLMQEITSKSISSFRINDDLYLAFGDWMNNGGEITLKQFLALERREQDDILCYLSESQGYKKIEHDGKLYILAHAGLGNFSIDKELDEYSLDELVWDRTDYKKQYFPNEKIFLVTGHTPVQAIRDDKLPIIFTKNNHIAIDCGCVLGGKLAAYCIETGEAFYTEALIRK